MSETPEQKKAREDRARSIRGEKPPISFEVNHGAAVPRERSVMSGVDGAVTKRGREPKAVADELSKLQEKLDEWRGSYEVPRTAKALYYHFCDVVRRRWPGAQLDDLFGPGGIPNKKMLKFAAELQRTYKATDLFEMIQVLVEDYENFGDARVYVKYHKGAPTPYFDQLFANATLLKTFVGKGVTGPNTRFSNYLRGYKERYPETTSTQTPANTEPSRPSSTAPVDPDEDPAVRALRERFNK